LFGERLTGRQLVGIALSLTGAVIVIARGELDALLQGEVGQGELLLLGCVVSWVLYTLIGKRLLHHLSPLAAVTYASVAGTLMLGVMVITRGGLEIEQLFAAEVWLSIAYLAVFGTVLAFVWYYSGVQAIGPGRAGQFINLVPVSGVMLGVLLLGEPLTRSLLLGAMLVVSGLWLTSRKLSLD
jgi:drug/metabolite transporter (DMT)-like permease